MDKAGKTYVSNTSSVARTNHFARQATSTHRNLHEPVVAAVALAQKKQEVIYISNPHIYFLQLYVGASHLTLYY